jgi:hypothetical protein
MKGDANMMKQMTRRITAALMPAVILVAGMASGPAFAKDVDMVTDPSVEQRSHTIGPNFSPVVQPDKSTSMVVSGPEIAKRPTNKMSWGSRSRAVPRVSSLLPVLGEGEGYVGLSWRF